jgi:hypothetical protein
MSARIIAAGPYRPIAAFAPSRIPADRLRPADPTLPIRVSPDSYRASPVRELAALDATRPVR